MATNFLDLATNLEYLGAKCLLKRKVNFVPCSNAYGKTVPKPWRCHHEGSIPHGTFCETLWDAQKNSLFISP